MGPGMDAPGGRRRSRSPRSRPPADAVGTRVVKYLDEYRDPVARPEARGGDPPRDHAAVDAHGGLRRPDPHDRQAGHRRDAPRRRPDDPRAGLPGLRHAARADRQGARDRRAAGRHLHELRRHAPGPGLHHGPAVAQGARRGRPDRLLAARRGPDRAREPGPPGRLLRRRLRDHRAGQRDGRLAGRAARPRQLQRPRQPRARAAGHGRRSSRRRPTRSRRSSPPATSARSWAGRSTSRSRRRTACRSSSPASSRSTCSRGSSWRSASSRRGGRRSRTSTRARSGARATGWRRRRSSASSRSGERTWRGIGEIPASGYHLKPEFARFDAETEVRRSRRSRRGSTRRASPGAILTGEKTPLDCTAYGVLCTPAEAARRADGLVARARARRSTRPAAGSGRRRGRSDGRAAGRLPMTDRRPRRRPTDAGRTCASRHRPVDGPARRGLPGADPRGRARAARPRVRRPALGGAPARPHRARARRGAARAGRSTTPRSSRWAGCGSPSRPTRSSSARSSSPAATSASWP